MTEDLIYSYEELQDLVLKYQRENIIIKHKINKAIDYINSFEYYIPEDDKPDLLDILKGEDNDR